ncbi:5449_t:CDS:2 [Entrophospora sp. SA101]|nr:5449_t:CDS:2 [Entrophospora sp. SA101]
MLQAKSIEKFFLKKEIEELYQRSPNYKYVFYLSLAIGLWGILDNLLGLFQYLRASQQVEQLRRQVEQLEREIV